MKEERLIIAYSFHELTQFDLDLYGMDRRV